MYKVSAALSNINIVKIPLSNDFKINTKEVLERVDDHSKILFICSPNNPTGNDIYPNLIILQTFSKAWGLAGIRLGMAFAHLSL